MSRSSWALCVLQLRFSQSPCSTPREATIREALAPPESTPPLTASRKSHEDLAQPKQIKKKKKNQGPCQGTALKIGRLFDLLWRPGDYNLRWVWEISMLPETPSENLPSTWFLTANTEAEKNISIHLQ